MISINTAVLATIVVFGLKSVSAQNCTTFTSNTTQFIENPTVCGAWVGCANGKVVDSGSCPSGMTLQSNICKTGTCTVTAVTNICQGKANGSSVASPLNNCQYYYCMSGVGYVGACNTNYYYNASAGVCQYSAGFVCQATASNGTEGEVACQGRPTGSFAPSPTSCYDYYYCSNNNGTWGTCGPDYFFDATTSTCTYPDDSDCTINGGSTTTAEPTTTTQSSANIQTICKNQVGGFAPDPASCQGYYYCPNGASSTTATAGTCPNQLYFDSGECVSSSANCDVNACFGKASGYFATNPYNCSCYLYCNGNNGGSGGCCPAGYLFNEAGQNCDVSTSCKPLITTTSTTTTTTESTSSSTSSTSSTDSSTTSSTEEEGDTTTSTIPTPPIGTTTSSSSTDSTTTESTTTTTDSTTTESTTTTTDDTTTTTDSTTTTTPSSGSNTVTPPFILARL